MDTFEDNDWTDFDSDSVLCFHCGAPVSDPRENVEAQLCNTCE